LHQFGARGDPLERTRQLRGLERRGDAPEEEHRQEYAPERIRVIALAPGAIRTPINRGAWETPEAYQALLKLIPYCRIGEPDDLGRAAVWLVSDEADYVTGSTLYMDGGMTLYPGFERRLTGTSGADAAFEACEMIEPHPTLEESHATHHSRTTIPGPRSRG
jgi:hypothetical protein